MYPSQRGFLMYQEEYSKNQETSQTRGQSAENLKMPLTVTAPPCEKQPGIGMWLKIFRGSFATCVVVTSASFIEAAPMPPCRKRQATLRALHCPYSINYTSTVLRGVTARLERHTVSITALTLGLRIQKTPPGACSIPENIAKQVERS